MYDSDSSGYSGTITSHDREARYGNLTSVDELENSSSHYRGFSIACLNLLFKFAYIRMS